MAHVRASTPSGPPEISPAPVTLIAPPLLTTGPVTGPEIVWREGTQAARAAPGRPIAASAIIDAEASSAGRERPTRRRGDWRDTMPFARRPGCRDALRSVASRKITSSTGRLTSIASLDPHKSSACQSFARIHNQMAAERPGDGNWLAAAIPSLAARSYITSEHACRAAATCQSSRVNSLVRSRSKLNSHISTCRPPNTPTAETSADTPTIRPRYQPRSR